MKKAIGALVFLGGAAIAVSGGIPGLLIGTFICSFGCGLWSWGNEASDLDKDPD
jgi:hypothetical protein